MLFASDEPWGDHAGERARLAAAAGDGDLRRPVFRDTFDQALRMITTQEREHMTDAHELTDTGEDQHGRDPAPVAAGGSSIYGGTKVFPDYQAENGESYFTLVHGIAHESSVSFVAILQATRALRKGFESAIYFYGPGSLNCLATRGFPTTGNSAFPGEHNINSSLKTFIAEGGKVYCCRFGLSLHGAREEDLIEGVIPTHPLDVQDALIHYARKGAIINSTYMF